MCNLLNCWTFVNFQHFASKEAVHCTFPKWAFCIHFLETSYWLFKYKRCWEFAKREMTKPNHWNQSLLCNDLSVTFCCRYFDKLKVSKGSASIKVYKLCKKKGKEGKANFFSFKSNLTHPVYFSPCWSDEAVTVHRDITVECGYRCNRAHFWPHPSADCGQRRERTWQRGQWNTPFVFHSLIIYYILYICLIKPASVYGWKQF